jgi:hypothetical protein
MAGNLEAVLSAVRKMEYQGPISIQKLTYFNGLALSFCLRSFRETSKQEEFSNRVDNSGLIGRFSRNKGDLSKLPNLPEAEKKAGFEMIKKSLAEAVAFILERKPAASAQKRPFHHQSQVHFHKRS